MRNNTQKIMLPLIATVIAVFETAPTKPKEHQRAHQG
jgi:hypothetical protein